MTQVSAFAGTVGGRAVGDGEMVAVHLAPHVPPRLVGMSSYCKTPSPAGWSQACSFLCGNLLSGGWRDGSSGCGNLLCGGCGSLLCGGCGSLLRGGCGNLLSGVWRDGSGGCGNLFSGGWRKFGCGNLFSGGWRDCTCGC